MELLEGVAAWYAGDAGLARERLLSARAKWAQLQVSDDALASLGNMGFRTAEVSPLPPPAWSLAAGVMVSAVYSRNSSLCTAR